MKNYQPSTKPYKVSDKCRVCKKKKTEKELIITGIDENNCAITKNACRNPICKDCLEKDMSK